MTTTFATTAHDEIAAAVTPLGTIVTVWAHPDDEAYLASGLMAAAGEAGLRVVCVTATRGEHGTSDPAQFPPERLASVREHELRASLAALGVTEHRWLPYEDGRCASVSDEQATARVEAVLAEVGADTVVTFGPDGMTGHPDHVAVGRWATTAARRLGVDRVLHATKTDRWVAQFADANAQFGVFDEGGPPATPYDEVALALELTPALGDRKLAALRAHATQTTGLLNAVGEDFYRSWWETEYFVDA